MIFIKIIKVTKSIKIHFAHVANDIFWLPFRIHPLLKMKDSERISISINLKKRGRKIRPRIC